MRKPLSVISNLLAYVLPAGFLLGALASYLAIPTRDSLDIRKLEIQRVDLEPRESAEDYLQFYSKNVSTPFTLTGPKTEIKNVYDEIQKKVKFPTQLTLWVAPPFLGFGQMQEVSGVRSGDVLLVDPETHVSKQRTKWGRAAVFLSALGIFFLAAIYFDWDWVWSNAD